MERFEARKILEILHTKSITTFCAPPTMYKSMVQVSDDSLFKLHSIRYCVGGGEAVNSEVAKVWKQKTGLQKATVQNFQKHLTETDSIFVYRNYAS